MHRRHIEALIAIPFVFHLSTVQAMGAELPVPEPAAVTDVFEYEETEAVAEETEELPEEAEDISEEETDAVPDQEQSEAEAGLLLTEEAPEAAKSAAQSDQGGDSMGLTAALANIKLYNPGKSAEQLVELLKESAKDLGKSGKDDLYGYGMPVFSDGEVPRPAKPQIESVEYACYAESEALKLTWEAQPGVQYEVLRRSGDGGKAEKIGTSSQGFFNDESYLNGHTYYYSIKCADEGFFKDSAVSEEKEYYAEGPDEMFWDISEEPIEAGKTRQIPESIVAYASRFSGVRWTSGDETIAKVSQSGLITGVGGGRTYIEVRDPDGRIRNRYDVVIVDKNKAGKNVYWYFDENTGTLTLTGSGDMTQGRDIVWPWSYEAQKGKTLPVKKIVIGENITSIGNSAFGNGLNRYSFHGLNTPVEIVGMEGVKKIGENAFSGLHIKGTFRLPENVSIGDFAFDGTSMEELYIPASVKNTGLGDRYIFSSGIGRYTVEEGNPLYSAQDGVLFDAGKTTLIACPKSLTGRYVIPETVKKIAYRAFFESNLTAVEIPKGVTEIADEAFCDAEYLREIIIPASVREIGIAAFFDTALTSVRVPKLPELSFDPFNGCKALRDLYYDGFRSEYKEPDLPKMNGAAGDIPVEPIHKEAHTAPTPFGDVSQIIDDNNDPVPSGDTDRASSATEMPDDPFALEEDEDDFSPGSRDAFDEFRERFS